MPADPEIAPEALKHLGHWSPYAPTLVITAQIPRPRRSQADLDVSLAAAVSLRMTSQKNPVSQSTDAVPLPERTGP